MNYKEFQDLLALRLGKRTDVREAIKLEAPFVQRTMLEGTGAFMPWFLLSAPTELTLLSGTQTIDFPTDHLQEREGSAPWYLDTTANKWYKIIKKSYDYGEALRDGAGPPTSYIVTSTGYHFHPAADKDYTIRVRYYKREATLVDDTDENQWLTKADDLFLAETGLKLSVYHLQNIELAAIFQRDVEIARQRLFVLSAAHDNLNRQAQMGED